MKKTVVLLMGLMLSFGTVLMNLGFSADNSGIENNHLLIAALYEKEASRLKGLMDLHDVMKKDYQKRLDEGQTEVAEKLKGAIGHCEAIIDDQKELYDDLVEFAKWHRQYGQSGHEPAR